MCIQVGPTSEATGVIAGALMGDGMVESRFISGTVWSLISAMLWASTFVCARHLLAASRVDPVSLSMIRFVLGAGILAVYAMATRGRQMLAISARDAARLAVLGVFGVAGMSLLLFFGQRSTTATNGALIMQSNPILLALLGLLIGERFSARQGAGVLVSLVGCLLVIRVIGPQGLSYQTGHLGGDLLVASAALSWALYSVIGKPLVNRLGGLVTATWAMLFGAAELVLVRLLLPRLVDVEIIWPADPQAWALIGYIAVFPTAMAFLAWYKAMNRIPLALLNVMQYLTPGFTILLAWRLLGERIDAAHVVGLALILAGVLMAGMPKRRRPRPAI